MAHKVKVPNKGSRVKCRRCGACCRVWDGSKWVDCRFLIRYLPSSRSNPLTRCAIYPHRLYNVTGKKQFCDKRERVPFNFPNCPYNKIEQPLHYSVNENEKTL